MKIRGSRLKAVYRKYTEIFSDSKKKLNYSNNKVIVISHFSSVINDEELEKIALNEARFLEGNLEVSDYTKEQWCLIAPPDHMCTRCEGKEKDTKEDGTTSTDSFFGEDK